MFESTVSILNILYRANDNPVIEVSSILNYCPQDHAGHVFLGR